VHTYKNHRAIFGRNVTDIEEYRKFSLGEEKFMRKDRKASLELKDTG